MGKKIKRFCENCQKKTPHEMRVLDNGETPVCLRCENSGKMLDIVGYIDPRERYSLRADRAIEEERIRIGRPF